jgi:3-oxoacyl-[acyl-carrier protein] reductase
MADTAARTGDGRRRAAVWAAGDGVGPAVVAALAADGWTVAADAAVPGAAAVPAGDAAAFLDAAEGACGGGIDLLVVSARPVRNRPVMDIPDADFAEVLETDLLRPMLLMREAGRRMGPRGHGRIVAFASMSAKTGAHDGVAPYAAAKGGLLAFVRVLATELAEHGVTVNAIATALFDVQAATMSAEKRERLQGGIPVRRFGRSAEAAHAVLFLAADDAGFVTGETLNLSGGRFMD